MDSENLFPREDFLEPDKNPKAGARGRDTEGRRYDGAESHEAPRDVVEHYLMTTTEVARFLGVCTEKVRQLMYDKYRPLPAVWLPGSKQPRFTKALIMEYINDLALGRLRDLERQRKESRLYPRKRR